MKEIKVKELKPGDIFVENDDYRNYHYVYTKIVESLRIIEKPKLVYVRFKFVEEGGSISFGYEIYDMNFNVNRLSV